MSYQPESITLYFKEGSSDKVYQTELVPSGEGWKVNFAFGRRGNSLQPGTKTTKPVTYEAAKRIYTKLISEKQAKGYSTGASGAPLSKHTQRKPEHRHHPPATQRRRTVRT
jgi:bifunctional non-homologous end joining protein LigD